MEQETQQPAKSRWKLLLTVATFAIFLILIFTLRDEIIDTIENLGKVNAWALLIIIPIEALNYDSYTRLYRSLFHTLGTNVKYWPLYRVTLELNFVNHILPSGGVSGISYFSVRLKSENVSLAKSTFVQFMKFVLLYLSFLPILVFGLLCLAAKGHTNNLVLVISSSIITAIILGTLMGAYIIDSKARISSFLTFFTRIVNKLLHLVRPKKPETFNIERAQGAFEELHENYKVLKQNWGNLRKPLFYMIIANLTEILALYMVYIAFNQYVNIGAVILAYAVANFAGLISVLPAGIGIYEGLMTAVLVATGIPAAVSIPVTLMFRIVSMTIQLLPGYIFYQKAVKDGLTTKL